MHYLAQSLGDRNLMFMFCSIILSLLLPNMHRPFCVKRYQRTSVRSATLCGQQHWVIADREVSLHLFYCPTVGQLHKHFQKVGVVGPKTRPDGCWRCQFISVLNKNDYTSSLKFNYINSLVILSIIQSFINTNRCCISVCCETAWRWLNLLIKIVHFPCFSLTNPNICGPLCDNR